MRGLEMRKSRRRLLWKMEALSMIFSVVTAAGTSFKGRWVVTRPMRTRSLTNIVSDLSSFEALAFDFIGACTNTS